MFRLLQVSEVELSTYNLQPRMIFHQTLPHLLQNIINMAIKPMTFLSTPTLEMGSCESQETHTWESIHFVVFSIKFAR